ncbi:MAG: isoprenyl transferase [Candidatus Omnitrophica bacterium]|nr:isoprenyl transferase [Candidatus Omnitrophota bacterium]
MDKSNLPKHIAIIMDGNGRWAAKHGLPKIAGHRQGIESLKGIIEHCRNIGISVLTVYAFSTENWNRPKKEVGALMGFIGEYIDREIDNFRKNEIRFNCIGRLGQLPAGAREKVRWAMEETKDYSGLIFNVALNYGGRAEIVDAINRILAEGHKNIDEESFGQFLYTKGLPDPDLLIRTSNEMRISNFLLWQASYSEFYFTKKLWPEFKKDDLEKAIEAYQNRERRFGGRYA